jgi:hypothetical protein
VLERKTRSECTQRLRSYPRYLAQMWSSSHVLYRRGRCRVSHFHRTLPTKERKSGLISSLIINRRKRVGAPGLEIHGPSGSEAVFWGIGILLGGKPRSVGLLDISDSTLTPPISLERMRPCRICCLHRSPPQDRVEGR